MSSKEKKYARIYEQLKALLEKETSLMAQLSTINAILYHKFPSFFWVGFYLISNKRLLVGPYQGPVACQELAYPKGVCWSAINNNSDLCIDNVEAFADHIACDSRSKSEIVLPVRNSKNEIIGVIDIDSDKLNNFDEIDVSNIRKILSLLNKKVIDSYVFD